MDTLFKVKDTLKPCKAEVREMEGVTDPNELLTIQLNYRGIDEESGDIDFVQATKYILNRCQLFYVASSDDYYIKNFRWNVTEPIGKIAMKKLVSHIFEEADESCFLPNWSDRVLKTMENYVDSYSEKPPESAVWSFPNGDFDIEKLEFGPKKNSTINYHVMDYSFQEDSDCPLFKKVIKEICCEDESMVELLQEIMGYCLDKGTAKAQKMFFAIGGGSNGKSIWTEQIVRMLPKGLSCSQPLHGMSQRFALSNMVDSAVNISPEVASQTITDADASIIKAVTGGTDLVEIDVKYAQKTSKTITAKCICCSNHYLSSTDGSHGFWRRIEVLPFQKRFVTENDPERTPDCGIIDVTLSQKLLNERAGIFNFAVEGLRRLRQNQYIFTHCERSKALKKEFVLRSNLMKCFISEHLRFGKDRKISSPDLHCGFLEWTELKGFDASEYENKNKFHKMFRDELVKSGNKIEIRKIQGKKFYYGFDLKS